MTESKLFWKEYIDIYCVDKGQTGLTIPNLVGSVRLNTNFTEYTIKDLLTEIIEEEFEILISFCNDINEYVIGKFKNWNSPKNYFQNIDSIYFSKNQFKMSISELNHLILEFENLYNDKIENKTYSKDEKTNMWIKSTDEDQQNYLLVNEKLKTNEN